MTEQPPSAEAQALAETIFKWQGYAFTDGRVAEAIDALIVQRVAAERERWQNRDRQRLGQIDRLQLTVQQFQRAQAERPPPTSDLVHMTEHNVAVAAEAYCRSRNSLGRHDSAMLHILEDALCERTRICEQPFAARPAPPRRHLTSGERKVLHKALLASSMLVHSGDASAVMDYTERARKLLRALHCWRLLYHDAQPIDDPDVGQITAALSAVASERDAAAIRAFGSRVWSDTEEVAYQAGAADAETLK